MATPTTTTCILVFCPFCLSHSLCLFPFVILLCLFPFFSPPVSSFSLLSVSILQYLSTLSLYSISPLYLSTLSLISVSSPVSLSLCLYSYASPHCLQINSYSPFFFSLLSLSSISPLYEFLQCFSQSLFPLCIFVLLSLSSVSFPQSIILSLRFVSALDSPSVSTLCLSFISPLKFRPLSLYPCLSICLSPLSLLSFSHSVSTLCLSSIFHL